MPFCVYGRLADENATLEHNPLDGPNPFARTGGNDNPSRYHYRCPHLAFSVLTQYWHDSLRFRKPPHHPAPSYNDDDDDYDEPSLQVFTIVRDPFSRLQSLFFFVKSFCKKKKQGWKSMFTEKQYDRVCAGDLEGWMDLLHKENGGRAVGVPYQYEIFDNNITHAISLIQGDAPPIVVLLQECYEESLRFMEHKFSLAQGSTDAFLKSNQQHLNPTRGIVKKQTDDDDEEKLRRVAMTLFPDDFKFYNAAVAMFQNHVASINLDLSSVRNPCHYLQKENSI
jgi:hypothetical protein